MCFGIFKTTVNKPSPSDIFKNMDFMWTNSAIYESECNWTPSYHYVVPRILRVKKEYVNIPFNEDPIIWPSSVPGTFSMDPVFDKEHHNMYLAGCSPDEQAIMINWLATEWGQHNKANIIVYESADHTKYAVHRLHDIKSDDSGRLWWFKGDNVAIKDKAPARDSGIYWVLANTTY
jgi:hypothetical protein